MARTLVAADNASLFGDTEFTVRDISHDIAAKAYHHYLEQKNGYQGSSITCPHCDYAAAYHGGRRHTLIGLTGDIPCSRAYYYCRRCGQD